MKKAKNLRQNLFTNFITFVRDDDIPPSNSSDACSNTTCYLKWSTLSNLVINNVIVTSLLLLKVIYMLANFLILSNTLLSRYFSFNLCFERNLDPANKLDNLAS